MNQLRPILRGNPTRAQRLVLCSAKLDEPPSYGKSRTLAALGLGGTLLATTQAASAVTAASVGGTSAVAAAGPMIGFGVAALKGIAAGLVAGSIVYGSVVAVREGAQPSPQPSEQRNVQGLAPLHGELRQSKDSRRESVDTPVATTRPYVAPLPVEARAAFPVDEVAAVSSPSALQATASTDRAAASAASFESPKGRLPPAKSPQPSSSARLPNNPPQTPPATAASAGCGAAISSLAPESATVASKPNSPVTAQHSLESEIALLDFAQRALAAGQPSVALQDLDTHRRIFANPNLLPEATLVRIEALLALGRSVEARKLGEQLLAAQPTGALAQRVKSLLSPTPTH